MAYVKSVNISGVETTTTSISERQKVLTGIKTLPAALAGISVANTATVDVYGSYVEFVAATETNIVITGVGIQGTPGQFTWTCDIATGASGSEVVKAQITSSNDNVGEKAYTFILPVLLEIPAGSRIALRTKAWSASANALKFHINYVEVV